MDLSDIHSLLRTALHLLTGTGPLHDFVVDWGIWAPIALVLFQAATVVIIPVPAGPSTLINTVLFGPWLGFTLSLCGTVAGSVIAFLLGRRYGWSLIRRISRAKSLDSYTNVLARSDGWWILPVLCVPVPVGGDLACFVAGLCSVRLRHFLVLVTVARVPGTALGVLLATGITTGSAIWLSAGFLGFAALFTIARRRQWSTPPATATATDRTASHPNPDYLARIPRDRDRTG